MTTAATSNGCLMLALLHILMLIGWAAGQRLQLSPGRREHVVFDGKSLFISCRGRDPIGMVWLDPAQKEITQQRKGSVRVEPSRDQGDGLSGVDLVLSPVKRKDRGKYVCRATVGGLQQETSFTLVVLKPITFKEEQRTQFAAEGSDFLLRCDVTGDPQPEVDWRGVTRHLQLGPAEKFDIDAETSGLLIRNVSRQDQGVYLCKATQVNSKNSDMQTMQVKLKVQYQPHWLSAPVEVFGYVEGSANLTCRADAEPAPEFYWFRGGDDSPLGQPLYRVTGADDVSVLNIMSVTPDMFGEFRCRAQNQIGSIEQSLTLLEGQKPAVPQVQIRRVESSKITLSIAADPGEMAPPLEFRAQYKTQEIPWVTANTVQFSPDGPFVLNNLQPATTYDIRVATRNQAGYGDFSAEMAQRTAAAARTAGPSAAAAPPHRRPLLLETLLCALIIAVLVVL